MLELLFPFPPILMLLEETGDCTAVEKFDQSQVSHFMFAQNFAFETIHQPAEDQGTHLLFIDLAILLME
jgi:hypothetical protein